MLKRIALLALMVTLGAALAAPLFAAQPIAGAAAVSAGDNGNIPDRACRVWSLQQPCGQGAHPDCINANQSGTQPTCVNTRCGPRNFNAANQAYACQQENTAAYASDADNQTFYELVDAEAFPGACNHTAFYAVQGLVAQSTTPTNVGNALQTGCPGATLQNCFDRADGSDADQTPEQNVNSGYSSAHTTASAGGLSPVPVVKVAVGSGSCLPGQLRLTWSEPEPYAGTMKNSVASPVIGVRLYSNCSPCSSCPGGATGWVPGPAFPVGAGSGQCVDANSFCSGGDTWFALTVRTTGPGGTVPEVETGVETHAAGGQNLKFVGANSQCVNTNPTAVRIVSLSARYAGRGSVDVNFTTGLEGGVQTYYVSRGTTPNGPFTRVSQGLSPRGDSSTYSVNDKVRTALGRALYYSVEIVKTDGTSERSGATAVNLPAAKRKLGN